MAILLDETTRTIDRQFETIESLNNRGQQMLGFAAVIVSVLAAFATNDVSDAVKTLILLDLVLFVSLGVLAFIAWRFQRFRDDPQPDALYEHYVDKEPSFVRKQLIGNRLASLDHNQKAIAQKTSLLEAASWILAAAAVLLVAVVAVRLLEHDGGSVRDKPYHGGHEQEFRHGR